jgi:hypothetical protein
MINFHGFEVLVGKSSFMPLSPESPRQNLKAPSQINPRLSLVNSRGYERPTVKLITSIRNDCDDAYTDKFQWDFKQPFVDSEGYHF